MAYFNILYTITPTDVYKDELLRKYKDKLDSFERARSSVHAEGSFDQHSPATPDLITSYFPNLQKYMKAHCDAVVKEHVVRNPRIICNFDACLIERTECAWFDNTNLEFDTDTQTLNPVHRRLLFNAVVAELLVREYEIFRFKYIKNEAGVRIGALGDKKQQQRICAAKAAAILKDPYKALYDADEDFRTWRATFVAVVGLIFKNVFSPDVWANHIFGVKSLEESAKTFWAVCWLSCAFDILPQIVRAYPGLKYESDLYEAMNDIEKDDGATKVVGFQIFPGLLVEGQFIKAKAFVVVATTSSQRFSMGLLRETCPLNVR